MKRIADNLYLKIAGFNIAIVFYKTEAPFLLERFTRERIKGFYPGFISSPKEIKKIDAWIDFIYKTSFEVMVKQNQETYFINFYRQIRKNRFETYYHISDNQFQIILRSLIQKLLVGNRGLILHASSSLINNKACIFLGDSGAGKSTSVNLLTPNFKPLADDSVIVKFEGSNFFVYQTPFIERNMFIEKYSKRYELGGLFFLKKSDQYQIKKITNKTKILELLTKQFLTDKESLSTQIPFLGKLARGFNAFYYLYFGLNKPAEMVKLLNSYV